MASKKLQGLKVALVIAPEAFRDEELFVPKERFEQEGAETIIASTKTGEATGMLGGKATADTTIAKLKSDELAAIVVVGGMGSPEHLWDNKELHQLLQNHVKNDKPVAAICLSGAALANAGVLADKNATVWECPESLDALKNGKAKYVKESAVQDGKIITANGPEAADEFASLIINELSKVKV